MELKIKAEGFKGHVKMRVAKNIERLEIMEKLDLNMMELVKAKKDTGISEEEIGSKFMTMRNMIELMKASKDFYVEVALEKGTKKYKSYDDLDDDANCQAVMMDCATKCIMGLGADESKKPKS